MVNQQYPGSHKSSLRRGTRFKRGERRGIVGKSFKKDVVERPPRKNIIIRCFVTSMVPKLSFIFYYIIFRIFNKKNKNLIKQKNKNVH